MWEHLPVRLIASVLFWLWVYPNRVQSNGNLTIGHKWGEYSSFNSSFLKRGQEIRGTDNYPGIKISCFSCSVLFGTGGYNPSSQYDDDSCVKANGKCTRRNKCCNGQALYCDKDQDSGTGRCKYDYSCSTNKDCENKGSSWKGYVCNSSKKCVKGSACVKANDKCNKSGRKCCTGQSLYCSINSGASEGSCKYDYSCQTDNDCANKGSSWKGYKCNRGKCEPIRTCSKLKEECDRSHNKCCYGYKCQFGQLRGIAGEGTCVIDYSCSRDQDCDSKGHKTWKCDQGRCYKSLCTYTHKCNNTAASHRAKCCLPLNSVGTCLQGECVAPETCVELGDKCKSGSDCCGNNQNSNICNGLAGHEWGRCEGCIELASGHRCRRDGDCCGLNECDTESGTCHYPRPKCVQNGFFCFPGGTPCCQGSTCKLDVPLGLDFPITICV